ncbi:MAG: hypothetical protein Q9225_005510 [Loekoesia sp. 1 TL-2023]
MKSSWLLAAVLSVEAVFAVPYGGLEPVEGKKLIVRGQLEGRVGGGPQKGSGRHRASGSKNKQPPMPGTKGSAPKNPDADVLHKFKTDELERTAPNLSNARIRVVKTRPKEGETAIHEERMPDGSLRYTAYLGDKMHEHTAGMIYREDEFGKRSRDAEYRLASDKEHAENRKQTLSGAPGNPRDEDGNRGDVVNDEKPPASVHLVPVNLHKVGRILPPTVIKGTGEVSRHMDDQLMSKMVRKCKEAGTGSTMRFRANPSPKFRENLPEVLVVKGPTKNAYIRYTVDETNYAESSKGGKKGSGGGVRSKRSSPFSQAASAQSNAESSHPQTSQDPNEDNRRYMEAYNVIRDNATTMLMPIIEEMVNGSNSDLVWNAAWEIMSLADRSIIIVGGPVFQGMHLLDWWEDSIANKTDNENMNSIRAMDAVFIDLYQTTWNKANDILDSSGLSHEMDLIEAALNGTSLEFDDSNADAINDFFLNGPNSTLASSPGDNSTIMAGNQTAFPANIAPFLNGTQTTVSTDYTYQPSSPAGKATSRSTSILPSSGWNSSSSPTLKAEAKFTSTN